MLNSCGRRRRGQDAHVIELAARAEGSGRRRGSYR